MAKQDKQTKQEQPDIEAQLEAEMGSDFVQTGANPPTFAEADSVPVADGDDVFHQYETVTLVNDETGETKTVRNKLGYAPPPIPFGWRQEQGGA